MEGIYDSILIFGASLKLQCLIGLKKRGFEFFNLTSFFN